MRRLMVKRCTFAHRNNPSGSKAQIQIRLQVPFSYRAHYKGTRRPKANFIKRICRRNTYDPVFGPVATKILSLKIIIGVLVCRMNTGLASNQINEFQIN